eukprot:gnl/MRDRNA2_/MRDRNA2_17319_c0_seq1.p1 gnl/MRDRNA2_/MRDRNA2_17319_c0~~gnl/MRDRNA2_/MRDRNA2_17319_c0_seq1.p1  ORF type:complete len:147 (+),score=24.63 gnl/MRDRNA2_/MRDRNA2_17319_c0_seq1:3-443(+)
MLRLTQDGQAQKASAGDVVAFKMLLGALTLLPFCGMLEGPRFETLWDDLNSISTDEGWIIAGSSGLLLITHMSLVCMMWTTSPGTVAVVSAAKVIPQWIMALMISRNFDVSILNLVGAAFICIGSCLWAFSKWSDHREQVPELRRG